MAISSGISGNSLFMPSELLEVDDDEDESLDESLSLLPLPSSIWLLRSFSPFLCFSRRVNSTCFKERGEQELNIQISLFAKEPTFDFVV